MKHTVILITLFSLFSITATAAPMVRVVGVTNAQTIVIDRNGVATNVRLAGVTMNPIDEAAAADFLTTKLVGSWVLVETAANGESYVYRSPDGLFINGELARAAWSGTTTKMTYLGESFPGPQQATVKKTTTAQKAAIQPPAKPHRVRTAPRGAHRIPRFPKM